MSYFLDTNTCIYALKGAYPAIAKHLRARSPSDVKVPAIVRAELLYGAMKSNAPKRSREVVEAFLFPFEIIAFDGRAASRYAETRADLEKKGHPIGPNDLIVAATVLASDGILVTHDAELRRVRGLRREDWTTR